MKNNIFLFLLVTTFCQALSQNPIGLQVDSSQTVLFGNDTMCCGSKMMWLPSKQAMLVGEMSWPYDSIGQFSMTVGRSKASGMLSASFGQSIAVGDYAFAAGLSGAIGNRSFAVGLSTSIGTASTAFGLSHAGGYGGVAGGNSTSNGFLGVAFGNSTSEGDMGASFNQATADAQLCTAIGRYNIGGGSPTEYVSTDPIFEVGIGTSITNRHNAFTIRKDGFISMGDHLGYSKFALYESGASTYGMGVVAGQFRFNIGNPQARYAFFDQPGSGANEIFTIYGNGLVNVSGGLSVTGNITLNGTVIHSSDRNRKEDIKEVNYREILALVNELPVSTWQYKGQTDRHLGPMAQDFYASFGLGQGDTGIATIDADGVALAAIKGILSEMETMKNEIEALRRQLALQTSLNQN